MVHIPVLLNETVSALNPKPGENFIDCTFGRGGHSLAILERTAPQGRILAIERDAESLSALPQELKEHPRIVFAGASYAISAKLSGKKNLKILAAFCLIWGCHRGIWRKAAKDSRFPGTNCWI